MKILEITKNYGPGICFCLIIGLAVNFGYNFLGLQLLDPLITSLIIGIFVRTFIKKLQVFSIGCNWSGKGLLEFAVMLMGATISFQKVFVSGIWLFVLILIAVFGGMLIAYFMGHKVLGLDKKTATLVGVGNSICGNSAVIAVAPVIKAKPSQIAAAISFSAILGAGQIILLPFLVPMLGINNYDYGIIAGISVYAVSQVVAASSVIGELSASVATTVKLTRVLFLGPLVVMLGFLFDADRKNISRKTGSTATKGNDFNLVIIRQFLPWFIFGFILLAILRSLGTISDSIGQSVFDATKIIFSVSMVGIGMGVDIREIVNLGPKIALTVLSIMGFMITAGIVGTSILVLTR